jgi:hypothetical protein
MEGKKVTKDFVLSALAAIATLNLPVAGVNYVLAGG